MLDVFNKKSVDVLKRNTLLNNLDNKHRYDVHDQFRPVPFAPKNTWVTSLNYLLPVPADAGVISLGATWVYIGEQRATGSSTTPYDMISPYELLNLNASWMNIYNSNFDFSLYATNVLDKEYITYYAGTMNALGIEVRQTGMPRMYGMRLRYSFGG